MNNIHNDSNSKVLRGFVVLLLCFFSVAVSAQSTTITVKVHQQAGGGAWFGKLYVPKGNKWRISRFPKSGTIVSLYSAFLDGRTLYMEAVKVKDGAYWIDATETDHTFVVRTTGSGDDVVARPMPAEEQVPFDTHQRGYKYFGLASEDDNELCYTASTIANATLRESSPYVGNSIYVMANPAKSGFAFLELDAQHTSYNMPAQSLYVLIPVMSAPLNVVWNELPSDTNDGVQNTATGIDEITEENTDSPVYTLSGAKVKELRKGEVYLQDGRAFIAK